MRLIDADALLDKTVKKNRAWKSITNSEGKNIEEIVSEIPTVQAIPIEEVIKIIEFEEKWLSQTRMSIRDIDIAFNAMKSKIKQIEGSDTE